MRFRGAVVLSLGLILAALVFGLFFYGARSSRETIQVVGSASRRFTADTVKWSISLTRPVAAGAVSDGYNRIGQDVTGLRTALIDAGIPETSITMQPASSRPTYDRNGEIAGYRMQQSLQIITEELEAAEALALDPGRFLRTGMILERSELEYFFSEIDSLKLELLAQATADARGRAERIAAAAGSAVGAVQEARAGVFQIREPFSTDVSPYGVYNTASPEKEISVTLHATFRLD